MNLSSTKYLKLMSCECTLESNSGRARTTIILGSIVDKVSVATLHSEGMFWPQDSDSADLSKKYDVMIDDIQFNFESLTRLRDDLKQWLEKPSSVQRRITADRTDDQIEVAFLEESELLSSASKPCFRLQVSGVGIPELSVNYLVDESCIRMFQSDLSRALEDV